MEIGNLQLKKQTAAECDQFPEEGSFFRCRKKVTWRTSAQKGVGTEQSNESTYNSLNY